MSSGPIVNDDAMLSFATCEWILLEVIDSRLQVFQKDDDGSTKANPDLNLGNPEHTQQIALEVAVAACALQALTNPGVDIFEIVKRLNALAEALLEYNKAESIEPIFHAYMDIIGHIKEPSNSSTAVDKVLWKQIFERLTLNGARKRPLKHEEEARPTMSSHPPESGKLRDSANSRYGVQSTVSKATVEHKLGSFREKLGLEIASIHSDTSHLHHRTLSVPPNPASLPGASTTPATSDDDQSSLGIRTVEESVLTVNREKKKKRKREPHAEGKESKRRPLSAISQRDLADGKDDTKMEQEGIISLFDALTGFLHGGSSVYGLGTGGTGPHSGETDATDDSIIDGDK